MLNKKILVVDNSPVILRLMENFLSKEGHHVLCAVDGLEALEILKKFRPDVIFVDLVMPRIPGEKLCRIIRTMPELAAARVIVLSAVAVEQKLDFSAFGAHACIAKGPFTEVKKHILSVFAALDKGDDDSFLKEVVGTEHVFKRIVTEELLAVKKHFDATLTHMHEGFLELTPEAQIVYVNPAAAALLGRSEEKILAASLYEFFSEEHAPLLKESFAHLGSKPLLLGEEEPLLLNGRQIAMILVCLTEQERNTVIAILQDISDRKKAERELREHRDHLEELVRRRTAEITAKHQHLLEEVERRQQAEAEKEKLEAALRQTHKMEALGTLAAGIAHDFNNILTAVIGYTEVTQRELSDNPRLYGNLEHVIKAGRRARDLIKHILTFSRKKENKFLPVRIDEVLREALRLLKASVKPEIEIREVIAPECGVVMADATQVHQIIMNLCTNALQAMKETGGTLEVRLEEAVLPRKRPEVVPAPLEKFVRLVVADTGVGIDQANLAKIFDPYFTTKKPGEGTGMGLAVVHGIVASHGGEISVASRPGEGSTFTVLFPEAPFAIGEGEIANSRMSRAVSMG